MTDCPQQTWPDVEERVDALLARMTLEELVGQLHQPANVDAVRDAAALRAGSIGSSLYASGATAGNVRDDGVSTAAIDACQEVARQSRLGIPVLFARDVIHGHRSVYPIPLAMAASFDEDLAEECAALAAHEARAEGVGWTFAPMVDIAEDPRWGRIAESLGEAPVLSGRMGAAMVRGFQSSGRITATAKHYVGYGMSRGGRDYASVSVGENTLRNVHLRPFKAAVDAGCATVMAAFCDVDGIPMHSHRHLLRDVLKGEWGFDGVVVADWNGIGELVQHGVAADLRDAARQAINAGVDVDMVSGAYAAHLADLVDAGEVDRELVVDAARRVLRLKFRLGLFDHPVTGPDARPEPAAALPTAASRALVRRAARSSMVLVKNDGALPLAATGTVHLTGPFLTAREPLLGTWTLDGRADDVATIADAFRERLGDRLTTSDGGFSDVATWNSQVADVTVMLLGEHPRRSGENSSIAGIGLPAGQLDVLRQVAALGGPVVAVVFAGRALDLEPVLALADAVLVAWHPGIEAGPALAEIVCGEYAPTGKLPVTFPRAGSYPFTSLERSSGRPRVPGGTDEYAGLYVESLTSPLLPFGYGLTYTTFALGTPVVSGTVLRIGAGSDGGTGRGSDDEVNGDDPAAQGPAVTVAVDVTNTGSRAGREVVRLDIRDLVAEVTRPVAELADFRAVELAPGETKTVTFRVRASDFGYYGRDNTWRVDPGDVEITVGAGRPDATVVRMTIA